MKNASETLLSSEDTNTPGDTSDKEIDSSPNELNKEN